ncbi:TonB family protein [Asticcacaulis biprosthecium]|uniref:TonB family protein n=1 Tax=Asticcacaulis biprosthecium TaxID=76891 RepID=UPI0012F4E7C4|nr:TonB family protein [Asticcacaulis biprosthecium]
MRFLSICCAASLLIAQSVFAQTPAASQGVPILIPKPVAGYPVKEGSDPQQGSQSGKYDPAFYIGGDWLLPDIKVAAMYYPKLALEGGIEGQVSLDCSIGLDGTVTNCDILDEIPKGYGFGDATARLFVEHFRINPGSVVGGIKYQARKKIIYRWAL